MKRELLFERNVLHSAKVNALSSEKIRREGKRATEE